MPTDPPASPPGPGDDLDALLVEHITFVRAYVRSRLDRSFRSRETASDLVASVCREVLSRRLDFEFQGLAAFRAWLCRTALLKLMDKHRHHHRPMRAVRKEEHATPGHDPIDDLVVKRFCGPATAAERAELRELIESAMDTLADSDREILSLRKIVGLSHDEIAMQLGITVATSRQRCRRALARLSVKLGTGFDVANEE